MTWLFLIQAKDALLNFLENKNCWSSSCQEKADQMYQEMKFDDLLQKYHQRFKAKDSSTKVWLDSILSKIMLETSILI